MGSFRKLEDSSVSVHLLFTNSGKAELYVRDTLKAKCKAGLDSIVDVSSKNSINEMLELANVQPFLAEKWLFVLDYSKTKSVFKENLGVFKSESSEFLIKVKNYKEFKEVKEKIGSCNDMYLAYAKYYDVEYLLKGYDISPKLVQFVARSYANDIEQIFVLRKELDSGTKVEKRKQITDICGISSGSLNGFVIGLLTSSPNTEKGMKMVIKNKISVGVELAEVYGFGKMRNFMRACVKDILDIKQLYMSGTIYNRISNLPEIKKVDKNGEEYLVYDEKRLARYNIYLNTIIEIPYLKILRMYLMLSKGGSWYRDIDMVDFIYRFYEGGEL